MSYESVFATSRQRGGLDWPDRRWGPRVTPSQLARQDEKWTREHCGAESTVVMPKLAQKIHGGRQHYVCGLTRGHMGQHRWPGDPKLSPLAQWPAW